MKGDEFYWSPDVGALVLRDGVFYSEYGRTYTWSSTIRMMPHDPFKENYADWSEEKRAQVRAADDAECAKERRREQRQITRTRKLLAVAKYKLTDDEYHAVLAAGRDPLRYD